MEDIKKDYLTKVIENKNQEKVYLQCRGCDGMVQYHPRTIHASIEYCDECVKTLDERLPWENYLFKHRNKIKKLVEEPQKFPAAMQLWDRQGNAVNIEDEEITKKYLEETGKDRL